MDLLAKLSGFIQRFEALEAQLAVTDASADPRAFRTMMQEYAALKPIAEKHGEFRKLSEEIAHARELTESESDPEMREMAHEELKALQAREPALVEELKFLMLPRDPNDERNVFVEIRAGTGGDEAALFAADLLRMYVRFAERKGWKATLGDDAATDLGGTKDAVLEIRGDGAYSQLKFESGVHRVQRVPNTETQGRIHTSAATVAVLPEVEEVDVKINESDLKIDTMRSGGAGGQHVNKTESAIRITHLPSGIAIVVQEERSQHKNRAKAMATLRARLYDAEKQKLDSERAAARRGQVGSGDRSERIRTYNFPQGRVSDHRINLTLYKLPQILDGEALGEIIDALVQEHQAELLAAEDT